MSPKIKHIYLSLSVLATLAAPVYAQTEQLNNDRIVHLGLAYPISSNGTQAAQYNNGFSLHALIGLSHTEKNAAIAGLGNIIKRDANGAAIAGLFNHIGNDARGVQLAGLSNTVKNSAQGVQLAGLANITKQAGGCQVAGLTNVSVQASGVQVAGILNKAKVSQGLQLSGLVNLASHTGSQVAGLINIGRKVEGVQLAGLINIADESRYPIGLINIIKHGAQQLGLSVDEMGTALLSFRSGSNVTYGIVSVGYQAASPQARYVLEGGLGMHIPVVPSFRLNTELVSGALTDLSNNVYQRSTGRLLAELRVRRALSLFAGPSINYLGFKSGQEELVANRYLWKEREKGHYNGLYWGATAGIQVNL